MRNIGIDWRGTVPVLVAVIGMSSLVYLGLQQLERQSMNDPQIEMVDMIGVALARNEPIAAILPQRRISVGVEASPWIVVYDSQFKPVEGNGYYGDVLATIPIGVLQNPGAGITNKVTWQPAAGVRQAVVVYTVPRSQGTVYVVSGRSMREGERRTTMLGQIMIVGCLLVLVFVTASAAYMQQQRA